MRRLRVSLMGWVLATALLAPAAVWAEGQPAPRAAARLLEILGHHHVGWLRVESVKVAPSGAERRRYLERGDRQGASSLLTRQYDDAGQLLWTSHWTITDGPRPGDVRLVERWPSGVRVTYDGRFEDGVLTARGQQPDGLVVSFRTNFLGSSINHYRQDFRDGRSVAMYHERRTPLRGSQPALSRK
jgi:hypothetical protein